MSTIPQEHEQHPSLVYDCPFCGAPAGQQCRARTSSAELDRPHSRRIRLANPSIGAPAMQALCCQCGQLRICEQPRNQRGWWGDPNCHLNLGDLKCSACGYIATHALISPFPSYRDSDEVRQLVALGAAVPEVWSWDVGLTRRMYHEADLPRNPYLHHRYWAHEARTAWQAGRREVAAVCGATMPLKRDPDEARFDEPGDDLIAPGEVRDQEYEDPDTGLWWVEMDCVDCLRVSNTHQRKYRIRKLLTAITEALATVPANPESWTLEDFEDILRVLNRIAEQRGRRG
jgi:hypothetical protein